MKLSHIAFCSTAMFLASCQAPSLKTEPFKVVDKTSATSAAPVPLPDSGPVTAPTSTVDASGVTTTPSGLRYRVLSSGPAEGSSPSAFDSVIVHYRGTLTDGTVFDSSYDRGTPANFGVSQVIAGWTEALKLMKPGDKWMLHIPSHLAYGSRGAPPKIPPNSDLIFQVELLQVIKGF